MASSSTKVVVASLVGNTLIAIAKVVAAALSHSSAMLSEGVHSLVDTGNQLLLLHGMRRARRPADERFPFGHGKEIYFWSFIVAMSIFTLGAGVSIHEGIEHLRHPQPLHDPAVNYVVLALAAVFEGAAGYLAFVEFARTKGQWGYVEAVQRGKDPTLLVVLFENLAALLGLVVAFLGVWLGQVTGDVRFDGAASIVIGLILAATAIWLARETKGLLIGESANRPVVAGIRELAAAPPLIQHVNEVLTMHMGPGFILVNISVDFAPEATADDVEAAIADLDRRIKAAWPEVKRVFVEAEARR